MFVGVVSRFESPMARSADSGPLASAFRLVCSSTCSCICFVALFFSSHPFCSPLSAFPPALSSLSVHLPCSLTVPPCLSLYLSPPHPDYLAFFFRLAPYTPECPKNEENQNCWIFFITETAASVQQHGSMHQKHWAGFGLG